MLRNYWQTPNEILENQGENKNRKNLDSYNLILYIADLMGPLFIVCTPPSTGEEGVLSNWQDLNF